MVVTEAAQKHFSNLLQKEEIAGMNLRVFVANPGTIHADVSVTYCPPGEEVSTDVALPFEFFKLFIDADSQDSLTDARIDFVEDALEGHLSVKAPFLKGREPALSSTLTERIQFVIDSEINPNLAGHGGKVTLVATTIISTSSDRTPADSKASFAALAPIIVVVSAAEAMCRLSMPVLSTIHSCEVSTVLESSVLESVVLGK